MENKDKYFTPEIKDIRIGYECEVESNNIWIPVILKSGIFEDEFCQMFQTTNNESYHYQDNIRVPYLTEEQIIKEGWKKIDIIRNGGSISFSKNINKENFYKLMYNYSNRIKYSTNIIIHKVNYDLGMYGICPTIEEEIIYNGDCKDLNTIKLIMKLLGI